ncbi:MAG: hypothetical protein MJ175_07695, partial [Clostridia bacterium]|nr:hypothetical protein [Clostridia bacterium]
MAKRKIDENIRIRLQEITGAPGYNACMAEELLVQVRDDLEIPDEDLGYPERFFDTLEQMYNDHELGISGRGNVIGAAQLGYVTGIFRGNAKGFGFLTPDPAFTNKYPEDLYIGRESTGGAMNGDRVTVRVNTRDARRGQSGRPSELRSAEGSVVRINERALKTVIGTLQCEIPFHKRGAKRWYIEPDDRKLSLEVLLNAQEIGDAKEGDKVEAEITRYPKPENPDAAGKIIHIFGDAQSKQANYDVILHENHIRTEFPPEVLSDADAQAARTLTLDGRLDLRDKIIFTIDGADSKDLDD